MKYPTFFARVLLACSAIMACTAAQAADPTYPTKVIRQVLGFPPGGALDAFARTLGPKLSDSMGQAWVVENRSGAGGNIGSEAVIRSAPDGHTVLLALNTQLTANPSLYKLSFDPLKDLQPVTMMAFFESIVVVNPGVPANSLKELVDLAQQKKMSLNYASSGVGTSLHLAGEQLKRRANFEMTHVPYKGSNPALIGLVGGETQVMVSAVPSTLAHVKNGRLRALATTGAKRGATTPEIPTVAESGYPGFESISWFGMFVARGTPNYIVERLRNEVVRVLKEPDVLASMNKLGLDPVTSTPQELARRIDTEANELGGIIRSANIQAE